MNTSNHTCFEPVNVDKLASLDLINLMQVSIGRGGCIILADGMYLSDCDITRRLTAAFVDINLVAERLSASVGRHFENFQAPMPSLSELDVVRQSRRGPPELRINATLLELEGEVHISYLCDTFFDAVYPLQFAMENEFNPKESWPHE